MEIIGKDFIKKTDYKNLILKKLVQTLPKYNNVRVDFEKMKISCFVSTG